MPYSPLRFFVCICKYVSICSCALSLASSPDVWGEHNYASAVPCGQQQGQPQGMQPQGQPQGQTQGQTQPMAMAMDVDGAGDDHSTVDLTGEIDTTCSLPADPEPASTTSRPPPQVPAPRPPAAQP